MSLKTFYKGKTVLVTGHTGFKGGWLVTWLKIMGAHVIGFSLPPENGRSSLYEVASVGKGMASVFGDIRDYQAVLKVFRDCSPEIVFHLAAQPLVRQSYRDPLNTYATNIMGTVHVLEAARHSPSVRAVVNVTSDKCYKNMEWFWGYREFDSLGGYDPYSSSKACSEIVTEAYRNSFFDGKNNVAVASARAGNVIGGGDWAEDRLVPDVIRAILTDEKIVLRYPGAIRPWQHVMEPLRGYLMLGERLWTEGARFAEAWNFGPRIDDTMPVKDLVERIIYLWGKGEISVQTGSNDLHETNYLKLDCIKASEKLNWRPLLGFNEAIEMTVAWYRSWATSPESALEVMLRQITNYMGLACL